MDNWKDRRMKTITMVMNSVLDTRNQMEVIKEPILPLLIFNLDVCEIQKGFELDLFLYLSFIQVLQVLLVGTRGGQEYGFARMKSRALVPLRLNHPVNPVAESEPHESITMVQLPTAYEDVQYGADMAFIHWCSRCKQKQKENVVQNYYS